MEFLYGFKNKFNQKSITLFLKLPKSRELRSLYKVFFL